ncbi:MAG: FliM/FliN family flagellar motor switch protein [Deltaproteobacteria bacterium]|nr:FliM/FliN family flagellar motor switch protein [Deltaproteobacteria bacterium]
MSRLTATQWLLQPGTDLDAKIQYKGWAYQYSDGSILGAPVSSIEQIATVVFRKYNSSFSPAGCLCNGDIAFFELLLAVLRQDRPLYFGEIKLRVSPEQRNEGYPLYLVSTKHNLKIPLFLSPSKALISKEFPVKRAMEFNFLLKISRGFLKFEQVDRVIETGGMIYTGWPVSREYFLGYGNLWIGATFDNHKLQPAGEWIMKPDISKKMPLDVVLEVGRIRMKGKDLDSLVEGSYIPLDIEPSGQINLTCDNRVIARGELLVSGGELVVKILSTDGFCN